MDTQWIHDMPKIELHLHLEGAIPADTVLEIARRNDLLDLLPGQDAAAIQQWYQFQDFYHFMDINRIMKNLLRSEEDYSLAVYAIGRELAQQHIRYAEITFTPYTHIHVLNKGVSIETILNGLEDGRRRVQQEFDIELRWIFDIPRNRAFADYKNGGAYVPGAAESTLDYAIQGMPYGVIGLGLGGSEVNAPPEPFAPVFARAKASGLLSLPHAGEGEGAASVRGAVISLQADRIGHGVRAIEDESLIRLLAKRQIPLEVNITSNVCLGIFADFQTHPLPMLDRAGVKVTVNTDNPPFFNTDLSQEFRLLVEKYHYEAAEVIRIARNSFEVCGAEPATKNRLLSEFDAWVSSRDGSSTRPLR